jgi:ferredoxin
MIITKQKKINELLKSVEKGPVFILGCNECATLCHTGGEKEVLDMKDVFQKRGIQVSGCLVLEPACHLNNDKRLLKAYKNEIKKSKKILVLSCGNGVQTIKEIFENKEIISGTDTLFLGEIKRTDFFEKRCEMCGDCLLDLFGSFCPVTRCPKSMLNGPCGGVKDGKCEIDAEIECIWDIIYKNLKQNGKLNLLDEIQKPKDWSKSIISKRGI